MKTLTAIAFIAAMYTSPVIALLAVVATLFITSLLAGLHAPSNTTDVVEDLWDTTEVTSCELACSVTIPVQPVLVLEEAKDEVVLIDYTTFSYKELQQKVKALRTDKSIKLNAKKSVLIKWLANNA